MPETESGALLSPRCGLFGGAPCVFYRCGPVSQAFVQWLQHRAVCLYIEVYIQAFAGRRRAPGAWRRRSSFDLSLLESSTLYLQLIRSLSALTLPSLL